MMGFGSLRPKLPRRSRAESVRTEQAREAQAACCSLRERVALVTGTSAIEQQDMASGAWWRFRHEHQ